MIFDLIGCRIRILFHSNYNFMGIEGTIVYETSKFLYIKTNSKIIKVYKQDGVYEIDFKGTLRIMHGYKLVGTPIKRLRKKVKLG